jgi:hypothetical protein
MAFEMREKKHTSVINVIFRSNGNTHAYIENQKDMFLLCWHLAHMRNLLAVDVVRMNVYICEKKLHCLHLSV